MTRHLTDSELVDYIYRALTDDQRAEMDRHLAACADCRAQLAEHETVERRVRYSVLARRNGPVPAARLTYAAIAPRVKRPTQIARFGFWLNHFFSGALVAAALLALVILLIGLFNSTNQPVAVSNPIPTKHPAVAPILTQSSQTKVAATATLVPPTATPMPYEALVPLFDYDQTAPLDIQETKVTNSGGNQVHEISYASPKGGRVMALLVTPPGKGPFAGILFLQASVDARYAFLDEANQLAKMGVVSLLFDNPFQPTGQAADRDQIIQIVVNLRRGIDLLTARADVDPHRLGFVGDIDGAGMGAVLAGVDKRIADYVFISGSGQDSTHLKDFILMASDKMAQYVGSMAQLDSDHFIGHAAPTTLLFQNGSSDRVFSKQDVLDFQQAASDPKVVKWYDAGANLSAEADRDRLDWLQKQLSLKPPAQ